MNYIIKNKIKMTKNNFRAWCLLEGSINWLINRKYKNLLKERKAREKNLLKMNRKRKRLSFFWSELNEARGFCLVKQIETDTVLLSVSNWRKGGLELWIWGNGLDFIECEIVRVWEGLREQAKNRETEIGRAHVWTPVTP